MILTDLVMLGDGDLRLPEIPRLTSPLLGEAGRFPDSRPCVGREGFDQTGDIIVSSELGGVSFRPAGPVVRDERGL